MNRQKPIHDMINGDGELYRNARNQHSYLFWVAQNLVRLYEKGGI